MVAFVNTGRSEMVKRQGLVRCELATDPRQLGWVRSIQTEVATLTK